MTRTIMSDSTNETQQAEYQTWWDSDAGKPASICDGCGQTQRLTQQTHPTLPDGGWILPYENFGYYGGFSDDIQVAFGQRQSKSWSLCHDCVVKFFETFPALANDFGGSHHPNFIHTDFRDNGDDGTLHKSCCRFAWTWKKITLNGEKVYEVYRGDGSGGWVFTSAEKG
jgi:hypothetical protein